MSRDWKCEDAYVEEMLVLFSSLLVKVKECEDSSPTSYFWYRKALDITDTIDETGELNLIITGCLLAAWVIVCLAMYKGIKSTGKVLRVCIYVSCECCETE